MDEHVLHLTLVIFIMTFHDPLPLFIIINPHDMNQPINMHPTPGQDPTLFISFYPGLSYVLMI